MSFRTKIETETYSEKISHSIRNDIALNLKLFTVYFFFPFTMKK